MLGSRNLLVTFCYGVPSPSCACLWQALTLLGPFRYIDQCRKGFVTKDPGRNVSIDVLARLLQKTATIP